MNVLCLLPHIIVHAKLLEVAIIHTLFQNFDPAI
ncbi:unnamed protein product [Nezara viridula]|uniref:Uncharacterized protein n=1 Tax=Nezara viridula TaxID=85310 RepID=A0A9P0E5L5_NEZVI|nr:unnamed protein product [Nezara viridula]